MLNPRQVSLDELIIPNGHQTDGLVLVALEKLATASSPEERGAFYTRIEIVEFMLDLIEYFSDKKLYQKRILEPSFGDGDFLISVIERLVLSWHKYKTDNSSMVADLKNALCAVELHEATFNSTKVLVRKKLVSLGASIAEATQLSSAWLMRGDFLLENQSEQFDYIVGNPPYLRQEAVPKALLKVYKERYKTMNDRSDIYIAFIEKSLSLLSEKGQVAFICSDRWTKNLYGRALRKYISDSFNLKVYVDMYGTAPFHRAAAVYPAITVISREKQEKTRIAYNPLIEKNALHALSCQLVSKKLDGESDVEEILKLVNGDDPWVLKSQNELHLLRRIESEYSPLEKVGCKVGVGVATGADKIFIKDYESLDIENDRKTKLVTTQDVLSGEVVWQGQGVINTFNSSGKLIDLNAYPKLKKYLSSHQEIVKGRYIAKKSPKNWYRTIDRIQPGLSERPKLLIPDIKGEPHIVYEAGGYYPHHNLYYITSDLWDLRALQAVLLSNITKLFVSAYSTRMRGGYLRFQAQYLRRICIPKWQTVSNELKADLIKAAIERNIEKCNQAVFKLYKLNQSESLTLGDM